MVALAHYTQFKRRVITSVFRYNPAATNPAYAPSGLNLHPPAPFPFPLITRPTAPDPSALLRRLENASLGGAPGAAEWDAERGMRGRAAGWTGRRWRGFTFTAGNCDLVVSVADGLEVAPFVPAEVQPLPLSREWVVGMISVRGGIYTVIDFARFVGGPVSNARARAAADANAAVNAETVSDLLLISNHRVQSALLPGGAIRPQWFEAPARAITTAEAGAFSPTLAPFLCARVTGPDRARAVLDIEALSASARFLDIAAD